MPLPPDEINGNPYIEKMVELEENLKTINNLKDKIKDLSESLWHR